MFKGNIKQYIVLISVVFALLATATFVANDNSDGDVGKTIVGTYTVKDCTYTLTYTITSEDTKEVKVSKLTCKLSPSEPIELTIPSEVIDSLTQIKYDVTAIGDAAFKQWNIFKSVTIPDSVTSIGFEAFRECKVDTVSTGDGVITIGERAFLYSSLKSIYIGENVTTIGPLAFLNTGLTSVTIGENVTTIGSQAFFKCASLKEVVLSDSVTTIGSEAFRECSHLELVSFGNCKASIGDMAFLLTALKSLSIGDGVTTIGESAFQEITSLESVLIGDGVTAIGGHAFQGCTSLSKVSIGSGVNEIKRLAFYGCISLKEAYIPDNVNVMEQSVFENCTALESVYIGKCIDKHSNVDGTDNERIFLGCTSLNTVAFGKDVTGIADSAFQGCTSLNSILLPDGLKKIGDHAFQASGLASVTIPDSVSEVGACAFYECLGLTSITMHDNTALHEDKNVFDKSANLKSLIIEYDSDSGATNSVLKRITNDYAFESNDDRYRAILDSITIIATKNLLMDGLDLLKSPSDSNQIKNLSFVDTSSLITWNSHSDLDGKTYVYSNGSWGIDTNVCLVSFDANGGVENPSHLTVKVNETIATLPNAVRTGYELSGWYYVSGGIETEFTTSTSVKTNMTLVAKWSENTYEISFHANGGVGNIDSRSMTFSDLKNGFRLPSASGLNAPEGMHFIGWMVGSVSELYDANQIIPCDMFTGDLDIYAVWGDNGYSVVYNLDGGTNEGKAPESWKFDVSQQVSVPEKEGYTFAGWKLSNASESSLGGLDASGCTNSISNPVPVEYTYFKNLADENNDKVTFTATWVAKEYNVTVNESNATFGSESGITLIPESGGVPAHDVANYGTPIVFTVSPNSGYRNATVSVTIDGTAIDPSKLTYSNGKYTIDGDAIIGEMVISVDASVIPYVPPTPSYVYYDVSVIYDPQRISAIGIPASGNIISGGSIQIHLAPNLDNNAALLKSIAVTVTMGGQVVDAFTYDRSLETSGIVNIDSVSGDVVITVTYTDTPVSDATENAFPWWVLLVLAIALLILIFFLWKRRKDDDEGEIPA